MECGGAGGGRRRNGAELSHVRVFGTPELQIVDAERDLVTAFRMFDWGLREAASGKCQEDIQQRNNAAP